MAVRKAAVFVLVCCVNMIAIMILLYNNQGSLRLSSTISTEVPSVIDYLNSSKHLNGRISMNDSIELLSLLKSNKVVYFISEAIQQPDHPTTLTATHSRWKSEFCRLFISNTFCQSFKVCEVDWYNVKSLSSLQNFSQADKSTHEVIAKSFSAVTCYRNSGDAKMATCVVNGLALNCGVMLRAMRECKECDIPHTGALWLLAHGVIAAKLTCLDNAMKELESCTEDNDYVRPYLKRLIESVHSPTSNVQRCDNIVMGRTHMFMLVDPHNIYFSTLAYYDIFKSILEFSSGSLSHNNDTVLRVSSSNYAAIDLDTERKLFPNFKTLNNYSGNACFQQAVLVPRAYSSVPFRCKTDISTRSQCQDCDGKHTATESSFVLFKKQVLKACDLDGEKDTVANNRKQLVFISRKPYTRFSGDHSGNFERVLSNSDELVRALKEKFPNTSINVVHLEDFSFCEQVKLASNADVLMGVHGAGLVHLWWICELRQL